MDMRGAAAETARGAIPRERLAELVARDLSVRAIAAEVDRSPTTVRYWLKRYGLRTSSAARRAAAGAQPGAVRICVHHGETLHVRRRDGAWRCARCSAESVTRWRQRVKRLLVDEAGGCCQLCGYDACIAALHFHHRDPTQKSFALGRGMALALDALRDEAGKCVLLCSNCHAEVEMGLRQLVA